MNITRLPIAIIATATLAACGGGGNSDISPITTSADSSNSSSGSGSGSGSGVTPTLSAQAYIKAANAGYNFWYGQSIAISGDTIVVGSFSEDSNQTAITNGTTASSNTTFTDAGAAYVYKRTGTNWAQEAYLKAPNAGTGDQFGYSVSISGDTIVVGAIYEDSNQLTITNGTTASANNTTIDSGAAYVFKRTGTVWAQEAFLKAPNATDKDSLNNKVSANFGWSVTVSGDTVVVGAPNEQRVIPTISLGVGPSPSLVADEVATGAAYVFKRSGTTWTQQAYLKAANAESGDSFGVSVALSNDTLVVGAPNEASSQTTITNGSTASANNAAFVTDNSGSNIGAGAAYVFKRAANNSWAEEAYLKAPNAEGGDAFGTSVGIYADTIVVGAPWEASNQTTITNGTTASSDNSSFVVGYYGNNIGSGAAYVFKRTGVNWAQEAYLKASNSHGGDQFGISVAIYADAILVGAFNESSNQTTIGDGTTASSDHSAPLAGAAYMFKRTTSTWTQDAYIKASNANGGDLFGNSVAIYSNTVVVGAPREQSLQASITNGSTASADNSSIGVGAAYVFLHQ